MASILKSIIESVWVNLANQMSASTDRKHDRLNFIWGISVMLKPDDCSSLPEFSTQDGYSGILIALPSPATDEDPWAVGKGEDSTNPATATSSKSAVATSATADKTRVTEAPTASPTEPSVTAKDLAQQYCRIASKSLAAKNFAQARSSYQIAIEWDSQSAAAHGGLAQVYQQIQDYENALTSLDRAIALDRSAIDLYYQRAVVTKQLKNYYQVLADCKVVLESDPEHSAARWLNAVALVKTERYEIALQHLARHINKYPQDPSGYCYRGICYERLEQFAEASLDLDRAIVLQPRQPVFHHARGRTRHRLGDLAGALADFNIAIQYKPQATVYEERAEVHRCLGDYAAAIEDCNTAISLNPKLITAYFRRGVTYTELGDLGQALANYTQTIDLDPEYIQGFIQRSWIYFRQQEYQRAKRDCQSALALDETCFWANYVLGIVNNLMGLKNNAIANFTKAIQLSPNYVSARYHRGVMYHELGDMVQAMQDFEQARSIQDRGLERLVDRDETGFYAEGLALYHLGQPEAARTILMLGALAAKRFNNPSFHQLIQSKIEDLGVNSGELYCRLAP